MKLAPGSNHQHAISFSQIVSALSYALDITEGQPAGHASRSCMLGMRIARELKISEADCSALFYALLLKDLGCSSNASKVCYLFGADDREAKCNLKTTDWTSVRKSVGYIAANVAPQGTVLKKASRFMAVAVGGRKVARELVQTRCDRGASIARSLLLPEATACSIRRLDEHWDGSGYPDGLRGQEIPLFARIMGLAQTVEVFWKRYGLSAACTMAAERSGTWFDPDLVSIFQTLRNDESLWSAMSQSDAAQAAALLEPRDRAITADAQAMDRLAEGFSRVIDAKSPWTFCHSSGVAEVAVGIARVLGLPTDRVTTLRRAALLHDIGKLGVPNLILDKPSRLSDSELQVMRGHARHTFEILSRVNGFREFAEMAAAHHERLDGRGYYLGMSGDSLTLEIRILGVADMYEALAARRPYRQDLTPEEVLAVLNKEAGRGLCPRVVEALKAFISQSKFVPYQLAA